MAKETDLGQGFVVNNERGILKDGKVIFNNEQLTALVLFNNYCSEFRARVYGAGFGEMFEDFFKGENSDNED